MDLRTRDYVLINGRSYRRAVLGPEWVLSTSARVSRRWKGGGLPGRRLSMFPP